MPGNTTRIARGTVASLVTGQSFVVVRTRLLARKEVGMTLKVEFGSDETGSLGARYKQVAIDTARVLWQRKWLITPFVVVLPALAFVALVLMGPRYTAEAMLELGFDRKGADTKIQGSIANVDASVLLDSAARVLRSRQIAIAVVARLGLDKDPQYTRTPVTLRALAFAQALLRLPEAEATPHDRAVDEILRRIRVTAEPRSYVISIATTAERPERATALVNAVAAAYLRNRMLQEVSVAENEMKETAAIYGTRHPQYQLVQTKLRDLEAELNALGDESKGGARVVAGDSFIPGDVVVGPSTAKIGVVLGVALLLGLACGVWMALHEAAAKMHLETILRTTRLHKRTHAAIFALRRVRPVRDDQNSA
jgi:capsular polysaccharide biosynthesis protein